MARQVPRMLWHPVPSRAFSLHLRAGALTCSLLISFVIYKESTLFLGLSFWLHQGRIPHRFCRFNCCLAAHQRMGKKDSAEPSFPILWTPPRPPGESAAAGKCRLPRAYRDLVSLYPVQVAYPQFRIWFGCLCSGWYRSRFSRVVGLVSHVFHYWGEGLFVPAATWCFAFSFVGFALTAIGSFVLAGNGMG